MYNDYNQGCDTLARGASIGGLATAKIPSTEEIQKMVEQKQAEEKRYQIRRAYNSKVDFVNAFIRQGRTVAEALENLDAYEKWDTGLRILMEIED